MANSRPDSSAFVAESEIDLALADAYPNPTREGCPSRNVIEALARRERAVDDPDWRHVFKCSPCYREVRAIQQAAGERRDGFEQPRRRWPAAAAVAAAVAALVLTGSWYALNRRDAVSTPTPITSESATQVASLDLRPLAVVRSDGQKSATPLEVPRGRVNATILLPVGAAPGTYELRILDSDLRVRASAKGSAEILNYITTLEAPIDLSSLDVGEYQLTLRRQNGEWQMFPLRVR